MVGNNTKKNILSCIIVISIRKSSYITYNPKPIEVKSRFPTLFERIFRPMFPPPRFYGSRESTDLSLVPGDGYSRDYLNWATLLDDYHRGLANCAPRRNVFTVSKDRYLESLDEIFPLINTMFRVDSNIDNWLKFDALVRRLEDSRIPILSMRLACVHLRKRWQLFKLGESIDGVRTLCKYGNHIWKIRVLKMSIKVMMIDER